MPEHSCTPDNAMAKLAAYMEARGVETSESALNVLNKNAQQIFHEDKSLVSAQALDAATPETASKVDKLIQNFTEESGDTRSLSLIEAGKSAMMDTLLPSQFLPESITEPIFQFLDAHAAKHFQNLRAGNGEYASGIRKVLDEVLPEVEKLDPATRAQFAHWARDLKENYIFSPKSQGITGKALANLSKGVLHGSGTSIIGNIFEFAVKAPSLYGIRPSFSGMAQLAKETKGNLWKTIPEIERAGGYGFQHPERTDLISKAQNLYDKAMTGLLDTTNRPLVNLAYYTGKAEKGSHSAGMEAIERISFKNRLGNDARLGRTNRDAVQLMSYTLNSYRMLYGMGRGMMTAGKRAESARQFGMWLGLTSLAGGGVATAIPAPLSELLKKTSPDYAEWEKANMQNRTVGKLVQPGNIGFYVGADIWKRTGESAERAIVRGSKNFQDGDINAALLDYADGGMILSTFTGTPFTGNLRFQKMFRNTRDLFENDISYDEWVKLNAESFLPALKQD